MNASLTLDNVTSRNSRAPRSGRFRSVSGISFDQRGNRFNRVVGPAVDIGAVEVFTLSYAAWVAHNLTSLTPTDLQVYLLATPSKRTETNISDVLEFITLQVDLGIEPRFFAGLQVDGSHRYLQQPRCSPRGLSEDAFLASQLPGSLDAVRAG
jgi:hypothetical protein